MLSLLSKISMGCMCSRETIEVDGHTYSIRSRLGEGGFSFVDLAEERGTHRLLAAKRIVCHSSGDEQLARKEIEYMNKFTHKNLVPCEGHVMNPVRNHATAISEVLILMPYYEKGSIQDELEILRRQSDHYTETKVLFYLIGICEGLQALHTASPRPLAHRDVKPHNVMLKDDDTAVLMDFGSMGIARLEIKTTSEATAITDLAAERCSMPYRAPELFSVQTHASLDEKVDIWSLGCTLYAMCYYESPFDKVYQRGDSIALAVQAGNVQPPNDARYSADLLALMLSMLKVNPEERPAIDVVLRKAEYLLNLIENRV
ncbi:hypothetical protein CAPTEDRAFT_162050 [Capitella teleta]|uniref:non-specific serine/threonine protein kinase n=1 Tax=Capitella teleta TaxID=283909 RepID=R7TU14_CAPTE|nr:hypothetical protein CAPTEDRAFT_162050 [Capitella teleta]|eukprot:ELT94510.1 hypothetical protein CAPTEDRAFT_162050 [Capitella teleta]